MKKAVKGLGGVLGVMTLGFALAQFLQVNQEPAQLRFCIGSACRWGWQTKEVSLGWLVSLSFLVGLFLSSALIFSAAASKSLEAKRLRRENESMRKLLETKVDHSSSSNV